MEEEYVTPKENNILEHLEMSEINSKDEKIERAVCVRQLSSEDNDKLYNVLLKIKESTSTAVIQLYSAIMSDHTFRWESTATGVVCLNKTDENSYTIEVRIS